MWRSTIDRATLKAFLARLGLAFDRPARVYLIGETTQVFEGWREWIRQVDFAAEVLPDDRPAFDEAVRILRAELGTEVIEESPGSETPQQDPAEFRRKFRGLLQMWRAASSQSPPRINP